MLYTDIFKELLKIVENDYSGYPDKKHLDKRDYYLSKISNNMPVTEFQNILKLYLMEFKDHHFTLIERGGFSNGFSTRRYKNSLYVSNVTSEDRLKVGDEIIKLDDKDIKTSANENILLLASEIEERQNFREVIKKHKQISVRRNGEITQIDLKKYKPTMTKPSYEFKIREGIPYLKLTDFSNVNEIHELISQNLSTILANDYLVIDVRVNNGGDDHAYFPIFEFLFDEETSFNKLYGNDEMAFLYSERNCDIRIELFKEYLQNELPEDIKKDIEHEIKRHEENRNKGFITSRSDDGDDYLISGNASPKHIYILTDCYCGSSGDSFVYLAKKSPKVTVVGRNTMGVLDYSNCAFTKIGDFEIMYPTSRMSWVDDGRGIDYIGVKPDVYIPFTPEHLSKDVDFQWTINDIKGK